MIILCDRTQYNNQMYSNDRTKYPEPIMHTSGQLADVGRGDVAVLSLWGARRRRHLLQEVHRPTASLVRVGAARYYLGERDLSLSVGVLFFFGICIKFLACSMYERLLF